LEGIGKDQNESENEHQRLHDSGSLAKEVQALDATAILSSDLID
jgi:hypothetical protein